MKDFDINAVVEKDLETGLYLGFVPNIPGAHTQAETLEELRENLIEVCTLCLEENPQYQNLVFPEFVGFQKLHLSLHA